jgi:hypothetical protein
VSDPAPHARYGPLREPRSASAALGSDAKQIPDVSIDDHRGIGVGRQWAGSGEAVPTRGPYVSRSHVTSEHLRAARAPEMTSEHRRSLLRAQYRPLEESRVNRPFSCPDSRTPRQPAPLWTLFGHFRVWVGGRRRCFARRQRGQSSRRTGGFSCSEAARRRGLTAGLRPAGRLSPVPGLSLARSSAGSHKSAPAGARETKLPPRLSCPLQASF